MLFLSPYLLYYYWCYCGFLVVVSVRRMRYKPKTEYQPASMTEEGDNYRPVSEPVQAPAYPRYKIPPTINKELKFAGKCHSMFLALHFGTESLNFPPNELRHRPVKQVYGLWSSHKFKAGKFVCGLGILFIFLDQIKNLRSLNFITRSSPW